MPRSYKPRHIPCPECPRFFTNKGGLSTHWRTHRRERLLARCQQQSNIAREHSSDDEGYNCANDRFDSLAPESGGYASDRFDSQTSSGYGPLPSPGASPGPTSGVKGGEDVRIHPFINGT
jgi:hypothetical protein